MKINRRGLLALAFSTACSAILPVSAIQAARESDDDRFERLCKTGRVVGGNFVLTRSHRMKHDNIYFSRNTVKFDNKDGTVKNLYFELNSPNGNLYICNNIIINDLNLLGPQKIVFS